METVSVKSCEKLKDVMVQGQPKPIYKVGLSDGRYGESFATEIPVGTPMGEIGIEETQYGLKFKWAKPKANGFAGGFKGKQAGNESFALSYAKDVAVAHIGQGKEFKSAQILDVADAFYNWLESKKQK